MIGLINRGNLPDAVLSEFENLVARIREIFLKEHNEDGTHITTIANLNFVPVGSVSLWTTNTAPTGWLMCDGSAKSRLTYKGLFDVIGTTYGAGDGSTTFNIPDLRQRFPLGKANAGTGSTIGGTGGAIDHTHTGGSVSGTTASESSHTHSLPNEVLELNGSGLTVDVNLDGATDTAVDGSPFPTTNLSDNFGFPLVTGAGGAHSHGAGTLAVGASGTNNPPYLVLNYIVFAGVV